MPFLGRENTNENATSACASPSLSMLIRYTASGWNSDPVMNGLASMINTVRLGSEGDWKTNRSVRSRRASSPGNLRLAALK